MSAKNGGQTEKGKKGKKGKNKKKLEIKLTKVEETFYELTVADCEKKLNHLRHHLRFIDGDNVAKTEQIRSLREDKVDGAAQMTNKVRAADETIYELTEKVQELSREYFEIKTAGDATITDLEEKYKAMHDQLGSEVKILKKQLNFITEFPQIEEKLNYVNEMEEMRRREKELEAKALIHQTECRIKGERDAMRKEIERKMLHVSEEFTRQSALRNAAYTQRLIRENIALEKEINILDSTWRSTDQLLKEQVARHKEVIASFPALKEKKKELIMVAQQKTALIEQLASKYEKIKAAYVESLLYKTQYEELVQYQLCGHFQRKELMNEAKDIGRNAHALKTDCLHMEAEFEKNKQEIENLRGVIGLIRKTVLKTIGVLGERPTKSMKTKRTYKCTAVEEFESEEEEEVKSDGAAGDFISEVKTSVSSSFIAETTEESEEEEEKDEQTQTLLQTLFNILSYYKLHKMPSSSLSTISRDRLLGRHSELIERSTDSLREAYKHGVIAEVEEVKEQLSPVPQVRQTVPTERPERCQLFDIEKGSTLYISISESNPEMVSVEAQQPDDQEEVAGSSSSDEISLSEVTPPTATAAAATTDAQTTSKKGSRSKISLSEMPAGTIIDVEMAEDIEEEEDEFADFDKDIYLADHDNIEDIDVSVEENEEEMPIYMFY